MKRCPACERAYDDGQTFCMEDGTVLLSDAGFMEPPAPTPGRYEPPPTEIYAPPVSTGSGYAPPSQPGYGPGPGSWTEPANAPRQYAPPVVQPGYAPPYRPAAPALDQNLAIASIVCGALGFMCLGALAGIPAIILGVIARNRAASEPTRYGGGGLAMAGIICGGITSAITVIYILLVIIGALAR